MNKLKMLNKGKFLFLTLLVVCLLTFISAETTLTSSGSTTCIPSTSIGTDITCPPQSVNIVSHVIVCNNEADLPNWAFELGDQIIGANTAQNYVNSHPNCHFESGWKFQYAASNATNPGDHVSEASGWTTFGPTDSNGKATVTTKFFDSTNVWVRMVFVNGYLNFTGKTLNNYSSEMLCYNDNKHYDNYDRILNPNAGSTYYCIAFTAREQQICLPRIINSSWSEWKNVTACVGGCQKEARTKTTYDANNCGTVANFTYTEYRYSGCEPICAPNVINTSWSSWQNVTSCTNGLVKQQRTRTAYDTNKCGTFANITYKEYRSITCQVDPTCTPNIINTSWSDWQNVTSCTNGLIKQERTKTAYDTNKCGTVANFTYTEQKNTTCQTDPTCTVYVTNSSWSDWQNITSCTNGLITQQRTRTAYDANKCGTFSNITYQENRSINCSSGNETQECCTDANCTTDYYGDKYCSGNDVYRKFYNFSCVNGSCAVKVVEQFVKECDEDCDDGVCVDDDNDNSWNDDSTRYLTNSFKSDLGNKDSLSVIKLDDKKTDKEKTEYSSLLWMIVIFILILLILIVAFMIIRAL